MSDMFASAANISDVVAGNIRAARSLLRGNFDFKPAARMLAVIAALGNRQSG
jgi:hypothetical protein